jgi:hypothetical protein
MIAPVLYHLDRGKGSLIEVIHNVNAYAWFCIAFAERL